MADTATSTHDTELGAGLPMPPASLGLPVEQRIRLAVARRFDLAEWRYEADRWGQAADSRYRGCAELRPLQAGGSAIRVGVKDTVDVVGFATRLGLRRYRHYPTRSAAVLRGLSLPSVNAKLVTTELSLGLEHGCVNPFFPHLDPAGSSTGCAVAVAANVCDLAMGTDTVASVRLPAAACGVVGLRMTHDLRLLDGIFRVSPLLDAPGWVARTADDLAYLWRRHHLGAASPARPAAPAGRHHVGVIQEALEDDVDDAVRGAWAAVRKLLMDAGHTLVPVCLGDLWRRRGATYELCARAAWEASRRWRRQVADSLSESAELALQSGAAVDDARHHELVEALHACRRTVSARFSDDAVDCWLLPVGALMPLDLRMAAPPASTIPKPGTAGYSQRVSYAAIASFAGLPAITFPVAHDRARQAPVALQAIGPAWSEERLIRLAQTVGDLVGDLGFSLDRYAAPAAPDGAAR